MNQDYIRTPQNIQSGNFNQAAAAANHFMGMHTSRGRGGDPGPRRMTDRYPAPERAPSPPSPMARRHSMREPVYERPPIVARRSRTDYETGRAPERAGLVRRGSERAGESRREPKTSVLAGLGTRGNRVGAWRTHVEPGLEPEDAFSQ